jgi:hypothetical protein
VTLSTGVYTVVVTSADGGQGEVLVEVYEVYWIAGHEYILDWYGLLKADPDPDGGASAVGNFKFEIGVPDSGPTVLLLGAGLLGLADTTGHFRETDEHGPLKSTSGPNNPQNFWLDRAKLTFNLTYESNRNN